ncbi:hypothetical protein BJ138DRAFT_1131787 [Hygrophoropsis aurantiaca]|uniref:Uncharacterized protein n=1 Tax=Hygrophoropsis aurantiaca TaxID=72124 RepID=A0ACB8AT67_9AGAM|nr:hypothetical protein BJ138DRAFT_1131787 [Hygrophoropsis aurantiaca]
MCCCPHWHRREWTPQQFSYPLITPCPHRLEDVRHVPYRPVFDGESTSAFTVSSSYTAYHRVYRIRTRGRDAVRNGQTVGGGADAAKELLYELAEYLPRRYPVVFSITRHGSISGCVPEIGGTTPPAMVHPTGQKFDLSLLEGMQGMQGVEMGEEALRIAALLVQEDMALMIEGSDRKYYFQVGAICIPGMSLFWRMREKIGNSQDEIHVSGNVPQYTTSMERFFKRIPVDKPVIRNNYNFQIVKPPKLTETEEARLDVKEETASDVDPEGLGLSESTVGKGDESEGGHGPGHEANPEAWLSPSTLRLRTERQTLQRLSRTGAIVFGIRTYMFKVEELAQESGVPGRLASAVRSWPEDVGVYKGRDMFREVLVRYLDECAEKDVRSEGVERIGPPQHCSTARYRLRRFRSV